jgi:hypothetical protein
MVKLRKNWFIGKGTIVSIIRVGLGESKKFAEGYEAIFGKKKEEKEPEKQDEKEPKKDETTSGVPQPNKP